MTPTGESYAIAAICEAMANNLCNDIIWCSLRYCVDGQSLDENIQAAVHARDRLDQITKR